MGEISTRQLVIETDTLLMGWDAVCKGVRTGSLWSSQDQQQHINVANLNKQNVHIHPRMDSTNICQSDGERGKEELGLPTRKKIVCRGCHTFRLSPTTSEQRGVTLSPITSEQIDDRLGIQGGTEQPVHQKEARY